MSTAKLQKDKPNSVTPRIVPRPTAASAARAARNATNRSPASPLAQRLSPVRSPPSPASSKIKTAVSRNYQKTESKAENKEPIVQEPDSSFAADNKIKVLTPKEHIVNFNLSEMEEIPNSQKYDIQTFDELHVSKPNAVAELTLQSDKVNFDSTPLVRPHTPTSVSSRPQTPKTPSRPNTPAHSLQRHGAPASRPNTPRRSTPTTRPKTPSVPINSPRPISPISILPCYPANEEDIKSSYFSKQKQFNLMKKDLDLKQQEILEVFNGMHSLRERMLREGTLGGGEGCQDLVIFNVADWAPEEVTQLCRDAIASSVTDGAVELFTTSVPIDDCVVADVESKTLNISGCFAEFCIQAFTARQELIDWIKDLIENQEFDGNDAVDRIARYNSQGLELCERLREMKCSADDAVETMTLLFKRVCRERSTLLAVGESLVREMARLRQDLESLAGARLEAQELCAENDVVKTLEETRHELEEERDAKIAIKDKLATAESQLRQTRLRVTKMDKQLREAEASIASLTGTVKSLEDQSRQREAHLEARARKLKETLKTGEVTGSQLTQKRDALQIEVNTLKEQIQSRTTEHKVEVQDLKTQLAELKAALEEEKNVSRTEIEQKHQVEISLTERENVIEELKAKVTELEYNRPNPELPTEREMDLWAELQSTKEILRNTEDEVAVNKRETVQFLETLTKIAESENKAGMQQKLAAELLSKEEMLANMQTHIRELTKNIKLNEQKLIQYEQYVRELQNYTRTVANSEQAPNVINYQDLQQEVITLRMGLLDAGHRNEELSEMLVQKEQQLEQQDKTSRAQARVIKIREELINMLKNKEMEQSRELDTLHQDLERRMKIVDGVNKQIAAKADEIQELFTSLENKQQQIHRLEKLVIALEEQQRRAQAQRTRQEGKIAALEHELAAGGNRRERKFIFF